MNQIQLLAVEQQFSFLACCLISDTYRGHTYRNHPSTQYPKHELEIELRDGSKYVLKYTIAHNWDGEDYYYSVLSVWPRISPPSDSTEKFRRWLFGFGLPVRYESRQFVQFIRKYDPLLPKDLKRKTESQQTN